MKKIQTVTKSKLQKVKKEKTKKGIITVRDKKGGKEARVTLQLNVPGVKNPRLAKYGATEEIARKRLAETILLTYIELQKNKAFANVQVFSPECQIELNKFDEYMQCVKEYQTKANGEKEIVNNNHTIEYYVTKMVIQKNKQAELSSHNKKRKKIITHDSVIYYRNIAKAKIIPCFGNMDATTVTYKEIQEQFDKLDCSPKYLQDIRLTLKLTFDVVIEDNLRKDNPAQKLKVLAKKKSLGIEIEHLEQDRQEVWLDIFEKDKRQWVYLFEAILLTGARPEEGCGFKWCAMDFERDIVHINNAYKDWQIYDDDLNIIGHQRGDCDLKSDESYRDIPMHPRLKKLLLTIKAERMQQYKNLGKKWREDDYVFLNQKDEPFISDSLSKKMPKFIKQYKLEHLTTYGLRHSFATLCSTLGMPPEVLHIIMGHSDFDTTRKYYIHITEERKRNEMFKLYRQQISEPDLKSLITQNDLYYEKIINLSSRDIIPKRILAS